MLSFGRLVWIIISVAIVGLTIGFVVSNETIISLSLWPFSQTYDLPTWQFGVAAFVVGGVLGTILMWSQALLIRTKLWQSRSQALKLQRQIAQLTQKSNVPTLAQKSNK